MATIDSYIHQFIPATDPENKRVMLAMHGTGGDEHDLVPLAKELSPGSAILSPRGQVDENGMNRWFKRFSEGIFDMKDLVPRAKEYAEFLKIAAEHYGFAPQDLIAVGYSNGANMALATLLLRPESMGGAVLFRPNLPFDPPTLPNWATKRVLVSFGQADRYRKEDESERLQQILRASHATVSTYWYRGGHELNEEDIVVARQFLAMGAKQTQE